MSTTVPISGPDAPEREAAIRDVFGARASVARAYAELLVTDGIERGVVGPHEAQRVWARHLFNSAALAELLPVGARVLDLGSGAGLPGIPLAIARPDLTMVLLEPMQRRVRFLRDCLATLDLTGVDIVAGRAEAGVDPLVDAVVVRAVAPLPRLVTLAFDLLVDNGVLLALKGASAATEIEALGRDGSVTAELLTVTAAGEAATVVRVVRPARQVRVRRGSR